MKKTMFITSVIMVVVMAIALTTSSLAWFTANGAATVTTSSLTLKAKVNSSAGLLMCNDASSFSTTSVLPVMLSGTTGTGTITDMRPVAPYSDTSVLDALAQNQFTGKTVDSSSGTNLWSSEAGYTDHYAGYIYVANAGDADINISAEITFDGVVGATLFVAVLAATSADDATIEVGTTSDWEIVRVAKSNGTPVANVTSLDIAEAAFATGGTVSSALASSNVDPCTNNTSTTDVEARDTGDDAYSHWQKFLILAWYSADLTNYNSGPTNTYGSFTVTFGIGA